MLRAIGFSLVMCMRLAYPLNVLEEFHKSLDTVVCHVVLDLAYAVL